LSNNYRRETTPEVSSNSSGEEASKEEDSKKDAPPNFTWVAHDELAGMGWPKSRDQVSEGANTYLVTDGHKSFLKDPLLGGQRHRPLGHPLRR